MRTYSNSQSEAQGEIYSELVDRPLTSSKVRGIVDEVPAAASARGTVSAGLGSVLTLNSNLGLTSSFVFPNRELVEGQLLSRADDSWFDTVVDQPTNVWSRKPIGHGGILDGELVGDRFEGLRVAGQLHAFLDNHRITGRINDEVALAGQALLDSYPSRMPSPQLSVSEEGELGLSWCRGADRVEAMIDPGDRRIYWIGKFLGKFVEGEDQELPDTMPRLLMAMLTRLFGRSDVG